MHCAMKRTYETHSDRRRQGQTDNDRLRQTSKDSEVVHRQSTDADKVHRQSTGSTDGQQGPQTVNRVHRQRQTPSVDELGVSPMTSWGPYEGYCDSFSQNLVPDHQGFLDTSI